MQLGGSRQDNLRDVAFTADGGMVLVGGTFVNGINHDLIPAGVPRREVRGTCAGGSTDPGADMDMFIIRLDRAGAVQWVTTIGGPHYERAYAVEVGANGEITVGGRAGDCAPTTAGVVQPSFAGDSAAGAYGQQDGYVVRLDASGAPLWSTYLGTSDGAFLRDLAVASNGDVVAGTFATTAATIPWGGGAFSSAFQTAATGGEDLLVVKLANDGRSIRWASRLGGSQNDGSQPTVRVDPTDDGIVVYTHGRSSDFNQNAPAAQRFGSYPTGATVNHGVLTRLTAAGAHVFTRYLGASGPVNGDTHNLWVHTDGTIYTADTICASSACFSAAGDPAGPLTSLDPPTSATSAQPSYAGGGYPAGNLILGNYPGDGYVVHLSQDGATVLGATLFGGGRGEGIEGVSVTASGAVVITGATVSPTLPAATITTGAYVDSLEAFVAVLSPDLREVRYVRYLGGPGDQAFNANATDGTRIAVVGQTGQTAMLHNVSSPVVYPVVRPSNAALDGTSLRGDVGVTGSEDGILYVFDETAP